MLKDQTIINLSKNYLEKAKANITTMQILSDIQDDKDIMERLNVPKNYSTYEWIVICGYYAMYTAALVLLSKIGFRSKSHTATLIVLEEFFVKKKLLDECSFIKIKYALFQKEELEKLSDARDKREIAQYSITKQTTKNIAKKIKEDAYEFVNKCEKILETQ